MGFSKFIDSDKKNSSNSKINRNDSQSGDGEEQKKQNIEQMQ